MANTATMDVAVGAGAPGARSRWARFWRKNGVAYLFILPAFLFLATFMVYPMADGLTLTLYRWNGMTPRQFVGFSNYADIIHDRKFLTFLINTVLFTLVTTVSRLPSVSCWPPPCMPRSGAVLSSEACSIST